MPVSELIDALASGAVEVVDLTQPLNESTPVIRLPPPFANTPGLSREPISRYDDDGPAWAWDTLTLGEHVGTHVDAPIHWITGKDGADIGSIPARSLIGPACVIDKTAETEADPGYLLTVADLEAWESEHGQIPEHAWVLLRTGWGVRAQDEAEFLTSSTARRALQGQTWRRHGGLPERVRSRALGWRRWASTRAPPRYSSRRSRCTTTCWAAGAWG